jgi:tRNA threonylcarbamoyl adenosine modification protein YeaZ
MKLFIDTSDRENIVVGIDKKRFKTKAREEKSQKLLPFIVEVLKKEKKDFKDISEIEVNPGPGSFTGLRVGVSVANALGWALDVPVNGKNIKKGESPEIKYEDL